MRRISEMDVDENSWVRAKNRTAVWVVGAAFSLGVCYTMIKTDVAKVADQQKVLAEQQAAETRQLEELKRKIDGVASKVDTIDGFLRAKVGALATSSFFRPIAEEPSQP